MNSSYNVKKRKMKKKNGNKIKIQQFSHTFEFVMCAWIVVYTLRLCESFHNYFVWSALSKVYAFIVFVGKIFHLIHMLVLMYDAGMMLLLYVFGMSIINLLASAGSFLHAQWVLIFWLTVLRSLNENFVCSFLNALLI